jgi:hypothetical protein
MGMIHRLPDSTIAAVVKKLERKAYPLLYFCFLLSIIFHGLLATFIILRPPNPQTRPKYIPIEVMLHQPRRPRPPVVYYRSAVPITKREYIYQRVPSQSAPMPVPSAPLPEERWRRVIDKGLMDKMVEVLKPSFGDMLGLYPEMPVFDTEKIMESKRRPKYEISVQDELLNAEDFIGMDNYGYERGMIFYNPGDKFSISGLVYLGIFSSDGGPRSQAMEFLAEGLETYTDIIPVLSNQFELTSRNTSNRVFRFPFIHLASANEWNYLPSEVKAVRKIIEDGGFVMFENIASCIPSSPADASFRAFIREVFGSTARVAIIPQDHPVYHSYFDFDEVPIGNEYSWALENNITAPEIKPYLEGIFIKERLVGILSNKGYCRAWMEEKSSAIKLGINILVYAMRRSDGNAIRKIDYSLSRGKNGRLQLDY